MDQNNYPFHNNGIPSQTPDRNSAQLQQQLQHQQQIQQSPQIHQQDLQALQNSQAFRQLQKQIQKMRKYYLSIGYSQKQVTDMLHEILLRKQNQDIDWKKISNTSDYYTVLERYNSTSQIAESALKFKKEINQMKTLCKNISQNCNNTSQQKPEIQQNGQSNGMIRNISLEEKNLDDQQSNNQSIFDQSNENPYNNEQQQNMQQIQSNQFSCSNSNNNNNNNNNFQFLQSNEVNKGQFQTNIQKSNLEKKDKQKGFDVNEISDRFLYRLDRNCSIERSSSSSESGDQDNYHYKINSGFIQSEQDIEQQALQRQQQQQKSEITAFSENNQMNNIQNNQNNSIQNASSIKQKQTFSQNIKSNYPDLPEGMFGNSSLEYYQFQGLGVQGNNSSLLPSKSQFDEQNLDYHGNEQQYCGNSIQEESYHSYSNESQISSHQKKKKIRKQKGLFQDLSQQLPNILEQNDILVDKQKKKICRGVQFRDDISGHKHNYAGKKRNHKFINQYQMQDNNEFQDFPDLDDLQLLEKKIRYFTENDLIDEDQNLPNQQ